MTPSKLPAYRARDLVVDDDLDTVQSMALLLRDFGHEVQLAINGRAAIDAARTFRPDVVLLDVHLPDVEGDKVARQLKSEPGFEKVRLIAVSADNDTKTRALEAGCAEFHLKPVSRHVLEELFSA